MKKTAIFIVLLIASAGSTFAQSTLLYEGTWIWTDQNRNNRERGNQSTLEYFDNGPSANYCYNNKCYTVSLNHHNGGFFSFFWRNAYFEFRTDSQGNMNGAYWERGISSSNQYATATIYMQSQP